MGNNIIIGNVVGVPGAGGSSSDWEQIKNKPIGGETDTIKVEFSKELKNAYQLEAYGNLRIDVEPNVRIYKFTYDTNPQLESPVTGWAFNGSTANSVYIKETFENNSITIDLNDYNYAHIGDGIVYFMVSTTPENTVVVSKTMMDSDRICADVKEGSIQPGHLAEEYYTKSDIDNMDIGGGSSVSFIDSSTIVMGYGEKTTTDEYDVLNSVNIPVEEGVIKYSIEYLIDPQESMPIGISGKNGEWEDLIYNNPTIITLADYDFEITEIYVSSSQENKVFITKFYDEDNSEVIKADVKEGSIQTKHLADGVVPTKTSQLMNDSEYVNQEQLNVAIPTNVSQLVNDEGYAKKERAITIADGETITVSDNTTYVALGEINNLTVIYPNTSFLCSLHFTLASDGNITITLPESSYIGGTPEFANGETWELSIKNGVVVGGKVE